MKTRLLIILSLIILFSVSCGSISGSHELERFNSEYISNTGTATTQRETKIELDDGAAIAVPVDSIDQDTTILIERNPEKITNLPTFGDGFVQLGDFYNFEVTSGELKGPVDLVLPFDANKIPEGDGLLVYAYPSENGWEFIPVKSEGNKVTVYTAKIGDPVIGWHFFPEDQEKISAEIEKHHYCDPSIAVSVIPESGKPDQQFTLVGSILPLSSDITTKMTDALASLILGQETSSFGNMPIKIIVNNDPNRTISATTNQDGTFNVNLNPSTNMDLDLKDGKNRVTVQAECSNFFDPELTSMSEGYTSFTILPPVETSITETAEQVSSITPTTSPIPAGAVLLPDFTGQTMTEAKEWLEENGFKYTWIDGASKYDLGLIYDQVPAPGRYMVPKRSTVILYRTNEKSDPTFFISTACIEHYYMWEIQGLVNYKATTYFSQEDNKCPDSPPYTRIIKTSELTWMSLTTYQEWADYKYNMIITRDGGARELIRFEYTMVSPYDETINIAGLTLDAVVYEITIEEFNNDPYVSPPIILLVKFKDYFDPSTGINLRSEQVETIKGCHPSYQCDVLGMVHLKGIYEIVETDFPFNQ